MRGNKSIGFILQDRDKKLLRAIGECRIIDREQAQRIGPFGSIRRANTRLFQLTLAGFLQRCFLGTEAGGQKALYMLTSKGVASMGGSTLPPLRRTRDQLLIGDGFVHHQMLVNSIWVDVHCPLASSPELRLSRWVSFPEPISPSVPLAPDGYFEIEIPSGIQAFFVEVDRGTEPLNIWSRKVGLYLKLALSGTFAERFRRSRFRVLVVAISERRIDGIRRTATKQTDRIFRFTTFADINRAGLWAPIWTLPDGTTKSAL